MCIVKLVLRGPLAMLVVCATGGLVLPTPSPARDIDREELIEDRLEDREEDLDEQYQRRRGLLLNLLETRPPLWG